MSQLGDKLKALRGTASLYEIAPEIGIPRGQLQRYENGQVPSPPILKRLAAFYEVAYEELRRLNLEDLYTDPDELYILQAWVLDTLPVPASSQHLVHDLKQHLAPPHPG